MDCKCRASVSYVADGTDTIKVHLDKIDFCPLHREASVLVDSLDKVMTWLDDGLLVRDISKDAAPDWAIKMLRFVSDLNTIKAVLERAKDHKGE